MKKKICIVTGTRAEYGLFYPLLSEVKKDKTFELQIIATGMHLSPEFGLTYREIEKDGFVINEKIEILSSSDTPVSILKSMGLALTGFAKAYQKLDPDLIIVLGDRFEIFCAATAAHVSRIPVAHIHGGEVTEGVIDDAFRHSITKMSLLHFTSAEEYRKRIIQLGESPERVFNVGALGIDNIKTLRLLKKEELEKQLKLEFGNKNILVTYHPVTLENNTAGSQFRNLLIVLDEFKDLKIIFTKPNADTNGRVIMRLIDDYVRKNPGNTKSFTSLGILRYLSVIKHADAILGNSSSGIVEVPSFGKPTVNVGDRQKGRIKAESIIDCKPEVKDIRKALNKALSGSFQKFCKSVKNPYGGGNTAQKILDIIKKNINTLKLKKTFYDLKIKNV